MAKLYFKRLSNLMQQVGVDLTINSIVTLEIKHFFSGAAVYVNEKICISLTPVGFALKLPKNDRNKLIHKNKAKILRYFPKGPIKKEYAVLSEPMIMNLNVLSYWVSRQIRKIWTLLDNRRLVIVVFEL